MKEISPSFPKHAIDKQIGNASKPFKSAKESNPWIYVDFGSEIQIDKVKNLIIFKYSFDFCHHSVTQSFVDGI